MFEIAEVSYELIIKRTSINPEQLENYKKLLQKSEQKKKKKRV
jgi:hypothetical protein